LQARLMMHQPDYDCIGGRLIAARHAMMLSFYHHACCLASQRC